MRELVKFIEHVSKRLKGLNRRRNISSSSILLMSIIVLLLQATSCTITKRVHRKGFHVEWHTNYKSSKSEEANLKEDEANKIDSIQLLDSQALNKNKKTISALERETISELGAPTIPKINHELKVNLSKINRFSKSKSVSHEQLNQQKKNAGKTVRLNPDIHANPKKKHDWGLIPHIIFSALLIFLVVLGWILYIGIVQSMFPWTYVGIYFVIYGLFLIMITCIILGLTYVVVYVAVTRDWDAFFNVLNALLNR